MKRVAIRSEHAPAAIGPYSQAIRAGGLLFCSGQIPIDPGTGELVQGGVAEQTGQVMKNLEAVLGAAGVGFAQVVKTTIYLADLNDFLTVNAIYGGHFEVDPPARATIQVAALPKGSRVEIDAIALVE